MKSTFTDEDVLLGEMMANVIATVIQNVHFSNARLRKVTDNLQTLSRAMVGSLEPSRLEQRIVTTIAEALQVQAASLYLINKDKKLEIRAADGYHRTLLARGAVYDIGEGTTGWIAKAGKTFKADSLEELHGHPAWQGKHTSSQKGREPNTFLGIPLMVKDPDTRQSQVIGVLKLEDRIAGQTSEAVFTDEDVLGALQPDNQLRRYVMRQVNLLRISPYRIVGPVDGRLFSVAKRN